jgi:hypothetical protein
MASIRASMKRTLLTLLATLALAACNSPAAINAPAAYGAAPVAAVPPPGGNCSAEIARYQAVLKQDETTGNVNKPVYDQAQREIAAASASCAAGDDAGARAQIMASRVRHGYPTQL